MGKDGEPFRAPAHGPAHDDYGRLLPGRSHAERRRSAPSARARATAAATETIIRQGTLITGLSARSNPLVPLPPGRTSRTANRAQQAQCQHRSRDFGITTLIASAPQVHSELLVISLAFPIDRLRKRLYVGKRIADLIN